MDSDIYGRHAATPDRPAGLPAQVFGRDVVLPWSMLIEPAYPTGRRRSSYQHPAGMHFERNGIVHFESFGSGVGALSDDGSRKVLPWSRVGMLLRVGETTIKELTSRD